MKEPKTIDLCPECYIKQTGKPYRERRFITEFYTCPQCGEETTVIIYTKRSIRAERLKNRLLFALFGRRLEAQAESENRQNRA